MQLIIHGNCSWLSMAIVVHQRWQPQYIRHGNHSWSHMATTVDHTWQPQLITHGKCISLHMANAFISYTTNYTFCEYNTQAAMSHIIPLMLHCQQNHFILLTCVWRRWQVPDCWRLPRATWRSCVSTIKLVSIFHLFKSFFHLFGKSWMVLLIRVTLICHIGYLKLVERTSISVSAPCLNLPSHPWVWPYEKVTW